MPPILPSIPQPVLFFKFVRFDSLPHVPFSCLPLLPALQSAQRGLRLAVRRTGPVWSGMFALGLGLGVLVTGNGLPWWLAPILSGAVYAGSVEFLLVGMITTAAPLSAIALTTLLVNARHIFYGLSFPLQQVRSGWRKLLQHVRTDG